MGYKYKLGSLVTVTQASFFKSYIGRIGTVIKFCNSRDWMLILFSDDKEIVFEAKDLCLLDELFNKVNFP